MREHATSYHNAALTITTLPGNDQLFSGGMLVKNTFLTISVGLAAFAIGAAASAQAPGSHDTSLCQQAVRSQIELGHENARIAFADKDIHNVGSGSAHARVGGKGRFTKKE
jgi:hypothetical protein